MNEEEIQAVANHLDKVYEEECQEYLNRVSLVAIATAGVIALISAIIIASMLTCVFG